MIQYVTMELRPRLQVCNVFILLQHDKVTKHIQIKLAEQNVIIRSISDMLNLYLSHIKIIPTTLSALDITNDWISFRVQTKPLSSILGSFQSEILSDSHKQSGVLTSTFQNQELLSKKLNCTILCLHCSNIISKNVSFARVLPYPESGLDVNEWFCCKHSKDDFDLSVLLDPRESDYFFGSHFSILHKNVFLDNNIKIDEKFVVCQKCLLVMGKLHERNSIKLWHECIQHKFDDYSIPFQNSMAHPLDGFISLIKNSVHGPIGEEIILLSFVGKENHCLLIKPMDRQLDLLTESKIKSNSQIRNLEKICVIKVLYKYEKREHSVIDEWKNVKYIEVGFPMIEAGFKYLLYSSKRYPLSSRIIGDYFVGFINKQ